MTLPFLRSVRLGRVTCKAVVVLGVAVDKEGAEEEEANDEDGEGSDGCVCG